jgi:methyltransferase (TIGR00027 family)
MTRPGPIGNVSDTAHLIAAHRASESARADALFHDALADRLAGEKGREIIAGAPRMLSDSWPVVSRTKLIDDLITDAIAHGCDRVLNLAAGLDTRPYRLDLRPEFAWVEADLPALLDEKQGLLAGEHARCQLTRHAVDLADPSARATFLDAALSGAARALVLTEGLLMYLDPEDVAALATALRRPNVAWWAFDLFSPALARRLTKKSASMLDNAPFQFAPAAGVGFFEKLGWTAVDVEPVLLAAKRFRRLPTTMKLVTYIPQPNPRKLGKMPWNAVIRLANHG